MEQVRLSTRDASRIAGVLGQLDAPHRFTERLGVLAPYWAKFLDPVQDALETRLVGLIAAQRKDPQ